MKKLVALIPAVFFLSLLLPSATRADEYLYTHSNKQPTFRMDAADSAFIVIGHLENARKAKEGEGVDPLFAGTTDLVITGVIKNHPIVAGKKKVLIDRYYQIKDPMARPKFLAFGAVVDGKPDLYRAVPYAPAVVDYLKGILAIDAKNRTKQLRYCFDFLEHKNLEIAEDAFHEFERAEDAELIPAGKILPPEKLRQWLQDEKTPNRLGMYAFLLGHCGTEKDADLLHTLAEKSIRQKKIPSLDLLLAGYVLLQPEKGWTYLRGLGKDSSNDFFPRFYAFKTAKFFYNTRPNVVSPKKIVDFYNDLMDQPNLADFPIMELYKRKNWTLTDRILSLWKKKSHQEGYIKHAIVHYALQCPQPQAAKFVAELRKTEPKFVADIEEILRQETEAATAAGK